jgi:pimeloyl-ACP methyl ester carboxylesterase
MATSLLAESRRKHGKEHQRKGKNFSRKTGGNYRKYAINSLHPNSSWKSIVPWVPSYWNNPHYDARKLWAGMTIHADLLRHLYSHTYRNYNMFGDRSAAPVPTLVFLGRQDFAIPPELWEKDKNVSHLDLIVLNHSGHTPQLEEQRLFDRELIQWLIQCRSK